MSKRALILLFFLSWLVTACQGAATTEATVSTATPSSTSAPTSSPSPVTTASPEAETSSATTPSVKAQCTAVSRRPTPGPTQESLFPPVSEADWVKGPDTADVTIIEYSDYQ